MVETPQGENHPLDSLTFRFATPEDIPVIDYLDGFSASPTRFIHREMEKYFGSVDPSTHERTLIFLAEMGQQIIGKAELLLPPQETTGAIGYIKRVVVHPNARARGVARQLLQHIVVCAQEQLHLTALDLHVWEENRPAIHLYEALGFQLQHRELYFRLSL